MPNKLSLDFWTHIYRVDDSHSFDKLQEEVKGLALKVTLQEDDDSAAVAQSGPSGHDPHAF